MLRGEVWQHYSHGAQGLTQQFDQYRRCCPSCAVDQICVHSTTCSRLWCTSVKTHSEGVCSSLRHCSCIQSMQMSAGALLVGSGQWTLWWCYYLILLWFSWCDLSDVCRWTGLLFRHNSSPYNWMCFRVIWGGMNQVHLSCPFIWNNFKADKVFSNGLNRFFVIVARKKNTWSAMFS